MDKVLAKIENEMKKQGITQTELCKQLGINQSNFGNWKSGATNSYLKKLPQIAEILKCSVDYLIKDEEQEKKEKTEMEEFWEAFNNQSEHIQNSIKYLMKYKQ